LGLGILKEMELEACWTLEEEETGYEARDLD
jgi:hypothetical protein